MNTGSEHFGEEIRQSGEHKARRLLESELAKLIRLEGTGVETAAQGGLAKDPNGPAVAQRDDNDPGVGGSSPEYGNQDASIPSALLVGEGEKAEAMNQLTILRTDPSKIKSFRITDAEGACWEYSTP
jgi:hypothetical protein